MATSDDFWLSVRESAAAYESAGLTGEQRAAVIVEKFLALTPIVQRELLDDLHQIIHAYPDLYTLVVAAANRQEGRSGKHAG